MPQQRAFDPTLPLRGRDFVRLGVDAHRWGLRPASNRDARVATAIRDVAAEEYAGSFWSNNARPGGLIELPENMDEEEYDEFKERWKAGHEGLKRAHDVVSPHGVTLIVEPLNTLVNHQGYYLNHTAEAFEIMREVSSPNVKILFDIYHVQIMDGNLIDTIRKNIASIDHFHVGDVPGRHEPGTGEIHYGNVFKAIAASGFTGFVAMEYNPSKDPMLTLKEVRSLYDAAA